MCGIVGVYTPGRKSDLRGIASRMLGTIVHRGPDDGGVWSDGNAGVALGHRRLAILELSIAGHQPMVSHCGRYVMVYNGEVYNHVAMRRDIEAQRGRIEWRGHSDTETLLAGFSAWGLDRTLRATVGMFALAVWDTRERTLTLARDRMGEKPLYYECGQRAVTFGSDLAAIRAHPDFQGAVDRRALGSYLRYGYLPSPYTVFQGVAKVRPGTYVTFAARGDSSDLADPRETRYWSMRTVVDGDPCESAQSAIVGLDALIQGAVAGQMVADVPVGAFLSGGVDSSLVVAVMQKLSTRPVKTFTVGFSEPQYNEAKFAREVARRLGTDHMELQVSAGDALELVPRLASIYTEPLADSSQIPTLLVCQLARQHVSVALSGDGGDELFGGYTTYRRAPRWWAWLRYVPYPARHVLESILMPAARVAGSRRAEIATTLLGATGREDLYRRLVSHWDPAEVVLGGAEYPSLHDRAADWPEAPDFAAWMMAIEAQTYMADDILVKVDRAAMAVSLETRVPLLDHRIVEFARRLPTALKIKDGHGKWLLRQVLYRYVPRELIERPKKGFSVPLGTWLRGPLRHWCEELIAPQRLATEGYFAVAPIRAVWRRHLRGEVDYSRQLWPILMFQAWLAEAQAGPSARTSSCGQHLGGVDA